MIKKSRISTPGSKCRMTDFNNECCSSSIGLIFAQIHRSSNRWQLPAIAALSQYPYHLFGSLRRVAVRACGIRPYCPRPLAAQRIGIGHIFHPLSYFTSLSWLLSIYRFSVFRSTFLFKSYLLSVFFNEELIDLSLSICGWEWYYLLRLLFHLPLLV